MIVWNLTAEAVCEDGQGVSVGRCVRLQSWSWRVQNGYWCSGAGLWHYTRDDSRFCFQYATFTLIVVMWLFLSMDVVYNAKNITTTFGCCLNYLLSKSICKLISWDHAMLSWSSAGHDSVLITTTAAVHVSVVDLWTYVSFLFTSPHGNNCAPPPLLLMLLHYSIC